jgi:PAS domain S-box-containing protein
MEAWRDNTEISPGGGTNAVDGDYDQALAAAGSQRVGWFRYFFDDDRWEWSGQVYRMHGYRAGEISPTTALILTHKHLDDYRQVAATLDLIRQTRQSFSSRHRIRDVAGRVHHVVVVGDELRDERGDIIGTHGFYIDVTPNETVRQSQITAEVSRITELRAGIEQAKGMLMMIYEIDEDAAFDLLKWRSQEANIKLRRMAAQIVADFTALRHDGTMPSRSTYDNLLLTAHTRISTEPTERTG